MRRFIAALLLVVGTTLLTARPVAAKDSYSFYGPLQIRIVGANGDIRAFIALSGEDSDGASELVRQITGAMQAPAQPIEEAAATLPHFRIVVSHLAMTYPTMPWARMSETDFIYYPGGDGASFLMVEFSRGDAALEERWIEPAPDVAAMIQRHLTGLAPIGTEAPAAQVSTPPLGIAIGALLLAVLSIMFIEDRRRWRLGGEGRSAGKGTDRRS